MINLLIVDDDMATIDAIRDSIHWEKLTIDNVFTSLDVAGAKKILKEENIDIIVSDIEMPQETGIDLLKWVRENKIECEFLFLTCHENFTYASSAINYNASAYLTKPFNMDTMELNLQKIVIKLKQKRKLKKTSEYGVWMEKNIHIMKLDFFKTLLDDEIPPDKAETEIEKRHLDIDPRKEYCLIFTRISSAEEDIDRYGKSVLEFILEDFHSEILTDKTVNDSVIKYHTDDNLSFITICEKTDDETLRKKCEKLIETSREYFKSILTCCIGSPCSLEEFSTVKQNLIKISDYNVKGFGKVFFEKNTQISPGKDVQILDLAKTAELVKSKNKGNLLFYLKQVFNELSSYNKLNQYSLYLIKQEITQVIYADLMEKGIHAAKLFCDDLSIKLADKAVYSIVDMIRWVSYIIEKTFSYEEEMQKSATIIEKINAYIRKHYSEDIGRNEIAQEFFLTPEYLSRLYKKKTGVSLKDYINEYRIEKAKELLKSNTSNVSEIAKAVGFDNYSYFSTLFKKLTGVSPKEYKSG